MKLIWDIIKKIHDPETNQWIEYFPAIGQLWKKAQKDNPKIIVGIIDSGVDQDHPDLKNNIFGCTGIDSIYGNDVIGHGTAVAGIIAAEHHNRTGLIGISNVSKIYSIKCVGRDNVAIPLHVARAIGMCGEAGCDIINISLGTKYESEEMHEACRVADSRGIIIIAPTGNDVTHCMYPAYYPEVVSVGATDTNGNPADFSAPGAAIETLGVNVYTTLPNNGYGHVSGTSFAAPIVAGLFTLFRAVNPKITRDEALGELVVLSRHNEYCKFLHTSTGVGRNTSLQMQSLH